VLGLPVKLHVSAVVCACLMHLDSNRVSLTTVTCRFNQDKRKALQYGAAFLRDKILSLKYNHGTRYY